jgi:hypothetical protein
MRFLPNNVSTITTALGGYDQVVFTSDISGSMIEIMESKGTSRFNLMNHLIRELLVQLPSMVNIGFQSVGGNCSRSPEYSSKAGTLTRFKLSEMIDNISPGGFTPLYYILMGSPKLFHSKGKKAVLLFSDGLESCHDNVLDLCFIAENLYAQGIDLHIVSFIVEGMEEYEYAYEIYNCMTRYSNGKVYEYGKEGGLTDKSSSEELMSMSLVLPRIEVGQVLQLKYIEVYREELLSSN